MLFPRRKINQHKGVPKSVFVSRLSAEDTPGYISASVYEFYKRTAHSKEFHPAPEMDICKIFDEGPEDIDDAA